MHCLAPWLHREERLLKILLLHKWFCKMQSHRQDPARSEAEFSPFQHPWVDGGRGARIWLFYTEEPLSLQPLGCSRCLQGGDTSQLAKHSSGTGGPLGWAGGWQQGLTQVWLYWFGCVHLFQRRS